MTICEVKVTNVAFTPNPADTGEAVLVQVTAYTADWTWTTVKDKTWTQIKAKKW